VTGERPSELSAIYPTVRKYQRWMVRLIVTNITRVPLAQKVVSARLSGYPFMPIAE
jgi:hypothetical protein